MTTEGTVKAQTAQVRLIWSLLPKVVTLVQACRKVTRYNGRQSYSPATLNTLISFALEDLDDITRLSPLYLDLLQQSRPLMPGEWCQHKRGGIYQVRERIIPAIYRTARKGMMLRGALVTDDIEPEEQAVTYQAWKAKPDEIYARKFTRPARLFDELGRFSRIINPMQESEQ